MSRQRARHLQRQPVEEMVRLELSNFIAGAGDVEVQRMAYTWRADDLLVLIRLKQPMGSSTLPLLRAELGQRMHSIITPGQPLQEWLVVFEYSGETIARVAHYDRLEQPSNEQRP